MNRLRLPIVSFAVALLLTLPLCIYGAGELRGVGICLIAALAFPSGLFSLIDEISLRMGRLPVAGPQLTMLLGWLVYACLFLMLARTDDRRGYRRVFTILCVLLMVNVGGCYSPLLMSGNRGETRASASASASPWILVDRRGDTVSDAVPDLIEAGVDISDDAATFHVRLAPGTFDLKTDRLMIDIDADSDPNRSGIDYSVFIFADRSAAEVAKVSGTSYTPVGTALARCGAEGCDVSVPLALLGTGAFGYRVRAQVADAPQIYDTAPDTGLARVRRMK